MSNEHNKNKLIQLLSAELRSAEFFCAQAQEDADTLIIKTALEVAKDNKTVIVVGQDIDLLVLLNQFHNDSCKVADKLLLIKKFYF